LSLDLALFGTPGRLVGGSELRIWPLALTVVLCLGVLAACGEKDGAKEQDSAARPAATASPKVTPSPTAIASPIVTPSPTATASPSPESGDAERVTCVFPTDIKSFRLTMTMEEDSPGTTPDGDAGTRCPTPDSPESDSGMSDYFIGRMSIELTFVAPDRSRLVFSDRGQECFSCITISDREWCKEGESADWTEGPASEEYFPSRPQEFCESIEDLPLSSLQGEKETVNGIETFHYVVSQYISPEGLSAERWPAEEGLPQEVQEVWLAEDGNWPVRQVYEYTFAAGQDHYGVHAFWEISDLNDPSITVEPPTLR